VHVLGQVGLLAEALAAERALERLLAGVRADVHIDRVAVLEALAADGTEVEQSAARWRQLIAIGGGDALVVFALARSLLARCRQR